MKYCHSCGAELHDEAVMCPKCGAWQDEIQNKPVDVIDVDEKKAEKNTFAIAALVSSFFIPIAGWILGGLGIRKSKELNNQKGKTMSIIAIVVASFNFIINFITIISSLGDLEAYF